MPESCRSGGDFRTLNRGRPPDGCGGQLSLSAINAQRHGLRYRRFGQVVEADCRLFPFNRNARLAPLGAPGPGAGKAMASGSARAVFPRRIFNAVFPMTRRDIARPGLEFRRHRAMRRLRRAPESTPLSCARALPPVQGPVGVRPPGHRPAAGRRTAPPSPSLPRRTPAPRPPAANRPPRHGDRRRAAGRRDPTSPPGMIPVFRHRAAAPWYADAPPCPSASFSLLRRSSVFFAGEFRAVQVRRRQRNSPEAGGPGSASKGAVFTCPVAGLRVAARQLGARGAGS